MRTTILIGVICCALLPAQSGPPTDRPKFDVVSVKKCQQSSQAGDTSPGRLHIGCGILANTDNTGIIQVAYNRYASGQLTNYGVIPIEGGPDWVHSEGFEIDARADGHPNFTMMQGPMMQTLLEDRFKLKIHRETRQGPVYELTLGKGAPKLKPFRAGNCIPVQPGHASPVLADGQRYCRGMANTRGGVDMEGGYLTGLVALLGMVVDRPVIDKTGIPGQFEIHLQFSMENPAAPGSTVPDLPDLFQAVQDQLGLKLVPAKGPVDVLVIDHIERPTEN